MSDFFAPDPDPAAFDDMEAPVVTLAEKILDRARIDSLELAKLLDEETRALEKEDLHTVEFLAHRKKWLLGEYTAHLDLVRAHSDEIAQLDAESLEPFQESQQRLLAAAEKNATILNISRQVRQRGLTTFAEAVRKELAGPGRYDEKARLQTEVQGAAPSVRLDETL
ncbi:hypothetical protein [Telmatospirillum sp. J64-1]|uniref:hypothetical protein n=1 Tax=Telmatospirillum sp. J64-1 TaxID=2502183 RepID=UPI00115E65F2|nr:hypothetical protein [Telmatospirillum sp. J64-1]